MTVPVHRREYDAFLSYGHKDEPFVEYLYQWLTRAGLQVFMDVRQSEGGANFAQSLQRGIERSRSLVLIATPRSIEQGWVKLEASIGLDEHTRCSEFRVIPLRLEQARVDQLIRATSWITLDDPELTRESATSILRAFYPSQHRPDPSVSRDVYVSASWRSEDQASAAACCRFLVEQGGLRLIGDSKDQEGFGNDRVERIIRSCGALVCILPFRDESREASATERPYKYFLREIDAATANGIATVVIADPRISRVDGDDHAWIRMETDATALPEAVRNALAGVYDDWQYPPSPHRIFLATDLSSPVAARQSPERKLLELVTGMPTEVGSEIESNPIQHGIIERIREAHLVIADISGDTDDSFNLDASIEAGMALSSGSNLRLLARGAARRPPFMLRTLQMPTFGSDVGRIAEFHRIARSYRRRVINAEL